MRRALALLVLSVGCASTPSVPPVVFAESAAYRKLKSDIVAFYEVDADDNGYPDGLIFSKTDGGFSPVLYRQEPMEETTRWVRVCEGMPLQGERLERLRFVNDGDARRLLATAIVEDPDRLKIDFAVYDPKSPCEPLLAGEESFEKPPGDVLSPGPVRIGLRVARDGRLLIVDSPSTTRLRGVDRHLDVITAVNVRQWQGSAAGASGSVWRKARKSLLEEVAVDLEWVRESTQPPDAIVSENGLLNPASTTREVTSLSDEPPSAENDLVLRAGQAHVLRVSAKRPFVLLKVRHGCDLGTPSTLELSSVDGPSLFVTGGGPVENGVFLGSASGRQKPGKAAVELGALREPTEKLALKVGPVERDRCLRSITAYGWTVPVETP